MLERQEIRRVFVTGGASGFGRAIARRLADDGDRVAIADNSADRLREASVDDRLLPVEVDVTDAAAVQAAIDGASDAFGGLDAVVLSAGVFHIERIEDVRLSDWNRVLAVNLTGAFLCSQAAIRHLRRSGRGRIVAITSDAGRRGYPWLHAYTASKFGLVGLADCLAAELARDAITVNVVAPAFCPTTGIGAEVIAWNGGNAQALEREVAESLPIGRVVDEADVVTAVRFFLLDESSFLTGVVLDVDGGRRLNFGPRQPDGSSWRQAAQP